MAITKVYSDTPKTAWKYDAKKGKYFSYKVDVYFGGRRIREKGFATKTDAENVIARLKLLAKEKKYDLPNQSKSPELHELFQKRIDSITERKQKELTKRVLNYFLQLETIPTNLKVIELTSAHLKEFVNNRAKDLTNRGEAVTPQTVNREMTVIAATLHKAGEYFAELENWVCPKIPRPKIPTRGRERIISAAESRKILQKLLVSRDSGEDYFSYHARLRVGQMFEVALLTGMRHGEIAALRWTDYDEKTKTLKVVRTKTDSVSYLSPLPETLMKIFAQRREISRDEFIFTKNGKTNLKFYRILKKACEAVGVKYGRFEKDGIILHDARHTFTTKLQQAGIDLATIQSFTGHSDKELVLRYSHARPESRKRAMQAIENTNDNLQKELENIYFEIVNCRLTCNEFIEKIYQLGTF
jgi:integrase